MILSSGKNSRKWNERIPVEISIQDSTPPIAKRTKSENRMQITEFPTRLNQHMRVLREMQGM